MKTATKILRRNRVRARLHGTATIPRLSVHVSNRHILAQLINDDASTTLAYVSTADQKIAKTAGKTMTAKATWTGEQIATAAKTAKISQVVFDRGERAYHGRVQALAEAARKNGLKF